MSFGGKSVIITGASSGIGAGLAEELARRGAYVTLAARHRAKLHDVAERCRHRGGKAIVVPTDVTDPESCKTLVDHAVDSFERVDYLVNNAGITMWARFDEITDLTLFERIMRVNYLGAVYCTHYALPHLKRTQGLLVAISSLTGKAGVPTRTAYAASKHALQGFCDSLRVELRNTGVDVSVISPGFVDTGVREQALGPDGQPRETSPRDESRGNMSLERCIGIIVEAMAHRRRDVVMTQQGRAGVVLKMVAPKIVDGLAARAVHDPGK